MAVSLAKRLRTLRVSLDLRQKEIAAKLGINLSTWRSWERGVWIPGELAREGLEIRIAAMQTKTPASVKQAVDREQKRGHC